MTTINIPVTLRVTVDSDHVDAARKAVAAVIEHGTVRDSIESALANIGSDGDAPAIETLQVPDTSPLPIVLVVEVPDEDPWVVSHGDVETWDASAFPISSYAYSERADGEYDDYPASMRTMADEADRRGATMVAMQLRDLAQRFETVVENDKIYRE
jgi:hypothetical protein